MHASRKKRPHCLWLNVLLCAALLAGCAADDHGSGDAGTLDNVSSTLPAPTSELLLFAPPELDGLLQEAKGSFRNQYPEVELTLRSFRGGDAADAKRDFCDVLTVELLAGRGPDLVLFDDETLSDPYKTMEAGMFCDIAPFFEVDPSFDRSLYCQAAFEGGIFRGEQLFVPEWD